MLRGVGKTFLLSAALAVLMAAYECLVAGASVDFERTGFFPEVLAFYSFPAALIPLAATLLVAAWRSGTAVAGGSAILSITLFVYLQVFLGMLVNIHLLPEKTTVMSLLGNVLYFALTLCICQGMYRALRASPFPKSLWALSGAGLVAVLAAIPLMAGDRRPSIEPVATSQVPKPGTPNIVVILIDALRADHLSAAGYARPTTPNIDRYARDGAMFLRAYAASNWTLPSISSIFTSLYPESHQVFDLRDGLPLDKPLITEVLQRHGYRTGSFSDNPNVAKELGYSRGVDRIYQTREFSRQNLLGITQFFTLIGAPSYITRLRDAIVGPTPPDWKAVDDQKLLDEALEFVKESTSSPFFVYVHLVSPHSPYWPPEPERRAFCPECTEDDRALSESGFVSNPSAHQIEKLVRLYDGEIRFTDRIVGAFLKRVLEESARRTIVVITSDHGESFHERGVFAHGNNLYEEEIRVPLIVFDSEAVSSTEVRTPVRTIDIYPTLLELAGIEVDASFQGHSLVGLMTGSQSQDGPEPVMSQHKRELYCLILGNYKLIVRWRGGTETELYDLEADPLERNDLSDTHPLAEEMSLRVAGIVERARQERGRARRIDLSESQLRRLKALGYIR